MLKLHELLVFRAAPAGGGFRVFSLISAVFQKKLGFHVFSREIAVFTVISPEITLFQPGPPENINLALLFVAQINAPRRAPRKAPKSPKSTNPH